MPTVRRRFTVSGRVQGVFYREGVKSEALRLGIRGYAENLSDGSVEVVAEGEANAVELLSRWLRNGPPRAVVSNVDSSWESPQGVAGFSVR